MDGRSITPRMPSAPAGRLTVGSLIGVASGAAGPPGGRGADAPAAAPPPSLLRTLPPAGLLPPEEEGRNWSIVEGEVGHGGGQAQFRPDGVEALTYNNPFGQLFERVWFDGRIVFALEAGPVEVDPDRVKVAQEYQIVYDVELDEQGKLKREPERVPGQYNIYDSIPGMERYSPIWQFNYVIVPRDYRPNTLRSERDCLASGYRIIRSRVFEN